MGLIDKLQSKLELYRLEQRYARRKNRSTFTTGAQYVDGEYVYTSPSNSAATSPTSGPGRSGTGLSGKNGWGSTRR